MTSNIKVHTETTPNPASLKFVVNKLLTNKSADFATYEEAERSPFAQELFQFSFVKGVFFAGDFITVTKVDGIDWNEISPILEAFIVGAVESELAIEPNAAVELQPAYEGTEAEIKIQEILDNYVKPAVEQDGGAIHYKSFVNGVVNVVLKGSCSGCPSSTLTLKSGIENLLKRMVPEVQEVVSEAM